MHVDEWIDSPGTDAYASWMLSWFRMPAVLQMKCRAIMRDHKLFCFYEGERWRVTGASRMGDVWLARDVNRETGYDMRVDVELCSGWGPHWASPCKCGHPADRHVTDDEDLRECCQYGCSCEQYTVAPKGTNDG